MICCTMLHFVFCMRQNKPQGGVRGHSKYAPYYREVCVLHGQGLKWETIAAELEKKHALKIDRTALLRMWRNRQQGVVIVGTIPPIACEVSIGQSVATKSEEANKPISAKDEWKPRRAVPPVAVPMAVNKKQPSKWAKFSMDDLVK